MRFASSLAANRMPSVAPLLAGSLLPVLLVLATVCLSRRLAKEASRLPAGALRRAAVVREGPTISVHISRQGEVSLEGKPLTGEPGEAWRRERESMKSAGFEPSQATVVIRADADVPMDNVQRLMEDAERAGFSRCVLRPPGPPSQPPGNPLQATSQGTAP